MGCVHSTSIKEATVSRPGLSISDKVSVYVSADPDGPEREQTKRSTDKSILGPIKLISNKVLPIPAPPKSRPDSTSSIASKGRVELNPAPLAAASNRPCPSAPKRWKKGEAVGSGSFGNVFVGLNFDTGELLAVKEVAVTGGEGDKLQEAVAQLEQEVQLLSRLRHPNIVQYVGTLREDNFLYIFLELIRGGSIAMLLSKFGPLDERVIRIYTRQLLGGLCYLHGQRTVHRDIKGANLLVETSGRLKLADFGMAKQLAEQVSVSRSFKGSAHWMAPEVVRQQGHGTAADIWSVGCTVLEMATAKPPWQECATQVQAIFKIASSNELPAIPESLSPEGVEFVLLCLQREPAARPSAQQLLQHPFVTFTHEELATIPGLMGSLYQPAGATAAAVSSGSKAACKVCAGPCSCRKDGVQRERKRSFKKAGRDSKVLPQQQAQQEVHLPGAVGMPSLDVSQQQKQDSDLNSMASRITLITAGSSGTALQLEALVLGNLNTGRKSAVEDAAAAAAPDPVLPSAFKANAVLVLPPVRMPQGQLLPPVQVLHCDLHVAREDSSTSILSLVAG